MEKTEITPAKNTMTAKNIIQEMLRNTDISINGAHPWDIQIHNEKVYQRIMEEGALGLGESYMDGWWDCERLDILFDKILRANLQNKATILLRYKFEFVLSKIINFLSKRGAKEVARKHYDLSNELFQLMLDKSMNYSCGYWKKAKTLDEAQEDKLELICQKLQLKSGMRLLDIGCGWGGLAKYAAEKYGTETVGITISQEQHDYAREYCKDLPVEIRMQDYRDLHGKFDRIVSVGMLEHVGYLNYSRFMQIVHRCLTDHGLFLLQTIGRTYTSSSGDEWMVKYIFPNGMLPSIAQIGKAAENLFIMEDWQNFGHYYDNTLIAWHKNFTNNWETLKAKFDERFYRMWVYYLLSCAGSFRACYNQLWQILFTKNGIDSVYIAPR